MRTSGLTPSVPCRDAFDLVVRYGWCLTPDVSRRNPFGASAEPRRCTDDPSAIGGSGLVSKAEAEVGPLGKLEPWLVSHPGRALHHVRRMLNHRPPVPRWCRLVFLAVDVFLRHLDVLLADMRESAAYRWSSDFATSRDRLQHPIVADQPAHRRSSRFAERQSMCSQRPTPLRTAPLEPEQGAAQRYGCRVVPPRSVEQSPTLRPGRAISFRGPQHRVPGELIAGVDRLSGFDTSGVRLDVLPAVPMLHLVDPVFWRSI